MIRPSALQIARHCQLAPVLSARFPTTNANMRRGIDVDAQVTAYVREGIPPVDPAAADCVRWLKSHVANARAQVPCVLEDVASELLITRGTADIVGVDTWDPACLLVVDLKKREQYHAGHLPLPDDNLQLHAYALAHALSAGFARYRTALLLFGDSDADAMWSREYTSVEWTPILDEIRIICTHEMLSDGSEPLGTAGPHCTDCYPRIHCRHWALPAHQGDTALAPLSTPGELTPEKAGRAYLAVKAMREMADRGEEILKAYRVQAGEGSIIVGDKQWGPTIQRGRKSADVAALEQAGLHQFVKQGGSYESWRLTKIR